MNNEIKEILEDFKNDVENNLFIEVRGIYYKPLLDYITNLQQKIEQYENPDDMTLFYMWLDTKAKDKIKDLQQENERLKETNVYCNRTDCVGRIKDSRKYDSVYQEKEDYKSRCEKANNQLKIIMQIIKEQPTRNVEDDEWIENRLISVVKILQNGSDSQ